MTYYFPGGAGLNAFTAKGMNAVTDGSSITRAAFDSTQIPANFGVSSSNNTTFTLTSGFSYIIIGSASVISGAADLQWYDETNGTYIGIKSNLNSESVTNIKKYHLNPQYRKEAVAMINSTYFGANSSLDISLRITTTSGSPTFTISTDLFRSGLPELQILKTI